MAERTRPERARLDQPRVERRTLRPNIDPEAFGRLVSAAYHDLLGRAPDTPGQTYWVTQLEHGLAPAQLLARFAGSAEFIAAKGSLDKLIHSL